MRNANLRDYIEWLTGYLANGGKPTHFYDRSFDPSRVFVADRDFNTGDECGANSAMILVNKGVRHLGGGIGHNTVLYFDGFKASGSAWIPIYSDASFYKLNLTSFIQHQRAESLEFLQRMDRENMQSVLRMQGSDIPHR